MLSDVVCVITVVFKGTNPRWSQGYSSPPLKEGMRSRANIIYMAFSKEGSCVSPMVMGPQAEADSLETQGT